ncbi:MULTISPECIES: DNA alkylation repair protein [unclassified Pseudonocardia]|uniref:DNA alkylation repair protein n=1 Tax=unclassified Pseudonocardia TaxID=2619320 RepID=UPI001CF6C8A6|nr:MULTISPECIES: DNA alkylation repair protein [unclassified Pseudonocardia]
MTEYGLKRHFDSGAARLLGDLVAQVHPPFDLDGYVAEVGALVPPLELKDRVRVLSDGLRTRLPGDYPQALAILLSVLGDELGEGEGMFNTSWYLMPVARFVEDHGLGHPEESLDAIEQITRRHTGEYAIRPYLDRHHDATMDRVRSWAGSPSLNVRRLASEGIRPRLPWARTLHRFVEDPAPVLEVLEVLRSDPSPYVRKSVANNLNDIARDHPDSVLDVLERWAVESPTPETGWISRHALRVLVKNGDQRALALSGVTGGEHVRADRLVLSPATIRLGESVTLRAEIRNTDRRAHTVAVDYVVHHVRGNGRTLPKVFKLAAVELGPGESRVLEKRHPVREVTTRRYYPGTHVVDLQVNGRVVAGDGFELVT